MRWNAVYRARPAAQAVLVAKADGRCAGAHDNRSERGCAFTATTKGAHLKKALEIGGASGKRIYDFRKGIDGARMEPSRIDMKREPWRTLTGRAMVGRAATLLVILLGAISVPAFAAELRQFTLMDGSVISGEIESVEGGIYAIKSPSLGTITIKDSEIRKIEMSSGTSAAERPPSAPGRVNHNHLEALQRRILSDDSIRNAAAALQGDPLFQDILNDPSIMEAVRTGNVQALEGNPKVLRLLDDPRVKEITKKLPQ